MRKRFMTLILWAVIGALFYLALCASFGCLPPAVVDTLYKAAEKGGAAGAGTAVAAAAEGDWKTAAGSGAVGVVCAALAVYLRSLKKGVK